MLKRYDDGETFMRRVVDKLLGAIQDDGERQEYVLKQTNRGRTALHYAAEWGRTEVVAKLLGAIQDEGKLQDYLLKTVDGGWTDAGETALLFAARNGHAKVVAELLGAIQDEGKLQECLLKQNKYKRHCSSFGRHAGPYRGR